MNIIAHASAPAEALGHPVCLGQEAGYRGGPVLIFILLPSNINMHSSPSVTAQGQHQKYERTQ